MLEPKIKVVLPETKPASVVVRTEAEKVLVKETKTVIVKIGLPGIQGASGESAPLPVEPLSVYLQARGEYPNGNNS